MAGDFPRVGAGFPGMPGSLEANLQADALAGPTDDFLRVDPGFAMVGGTSADLIQRARKHRLAPRETWAIEVGTFSYVLPDDVGAGEDATGTSLSATPQSGSSPPRTRATVLTAFPFAALSGTTAAARSRAFASRSGGPSCRPCSTPTPRGYVWRSLPTGPAGRAPSCSRHRAWSPRSDRR